MASGPKFPLGNLCRANPKPGNDPSAEKQPSRSNSPASSLPWVPDRNSWDGFVESPARTRGQWASNASWNGPGRGPPPRSSGRASRPVIGVPMATNSFLE